MARKTWQSRATIRRNAKAIQQIKQFSEEDLIAFGDLTIELARDNVPVLTGDLKASLIAIYKGSMRLILRSRTKYGGYVEFGTKRMPARPYMANAVHEALGKMQEIIRKHG